MNHLNRWLWLACALGTLFGGNAWAQTDAEVPFRPRGGSPIQPREPSDTLFVVRTGPGLDTGCTFRSGGPLVINLPINRYYGPVDSQGRLQNAAELVRKGVIAAKAKVRLPAFDVDSSASTSNGQSPEVDKLYVNGEFIRNLTGQDGTWILQEFEVPIEKLKFPDAAQPGSTLVPRMNEIRLDIDTANVGVCECWCTAIAWIELELKAAAPIVLVHGINANRSTWNDWVNSPELRDSGFPYITVELGRNARVDDSPGFLPFTTSKGNSTLLKERLQGISAQLGTQSYHLICHSKGGLDTRRFIHLNSRPTDPKVLSLYTLSTPHWGSVHADIIVAADSGGYASSRDSQINDFIRNSSGFMNFVGELVNAVPERPGVDDLQTSVCAARNRTTPAPARVKLYTYSADADTNNDGSINDSERAQLIPDIPILPFDENAVATNMYRVLRDTSSVSTTTTTTLVIIPPSAIPVLVRSTQITGNVNAAPKLNDLSVTTDSARLPGQISHTGPLDLNHGSIKNSRTVLSGILSRIRADFPIR